MKANELMIGNYVEYNGMTMRVSEICSPKPLRDKRYSDKFIIELFDGAGLLSCTLDDLEPIPLTEGWLLKFGFEKNHELNFIKFSFTVHFWSNYNSYMYGWIGGNTEIKYVHQLQNLYFALTNTELQCN